MKIQIIYFSYRYMTSIILSSGIIGAITCQNGCLGMKLDHLLCVFPVNLVFSLKIMNMQIRSFAFFIIQYQAYVSAL